MQTAVFNKRIWWWWWWRWWLLETTNTRM